MKNSVISTFLATLMASAFAGGAFALEGEYYEGIDSGRDHPMATTDALGIPSMTRYGYPPLSGAREFNNFATPTLDNGDYYDGAIRPN